MESEDEDEAHQMPARLWFYWKLGAVANFVRNLKVVNRDGIDFPASFGQLQESTGHKDFQFVLLELLSRTITGLEIIGENNVTCVEAKDSAVLFNFLLRLAKLVDEPWVRAVLLHEKALPYKLVKITSYVRGKDHDVIDYDHALFY